MYLVAGYSYWLPDYMKNILGISTEKATLCWSLIFISSSILGMSLSGPSINKFGGYSSSNAKPFIIII